MIGRNSHTVLRARNYFDPSQPRDEGGKWTSSVGAGGRSVPARDIRGSVKRAWLQSGKASVERGSTNRSQVALRLREKRGSYDFKIQEYPYGHSRYGLAKPVRLNKLAEHIKKHPDKYDVSVGSWTAGAPRASGSGSRINYGATSSTGKKIEVRKGGKQIIREDTTWGTTGEMVAQRWNRHLREKTGDS